MAHDLSRPERTSAGELPPSAEIKQVLDATVTPGSHPVLRAIAELLIRHREQWVAEDRCREVTDDASLAALKRSIDSMNRGRVSVVDSVDQWAALELAENPTAPLHTETLGQLVDRMAVAAVRVEQLGTAVREGGHGAADARRAERQLDDLCTAYDVLVSALRDGGRRLPSWKPLKRYGTNQAPSEV